ncbi:hypothetical protein EK904_001992 [Melospiza melodia maxima]|nr:hypothetical protein EK904_001992 [Melospiza melodia maxima]
MARPLAELLPGLCKINKTPMLCHPLITRKTGLQSVTSLKTGFGGKPALLNNSGYVYGWSPALFSPARVVTAPGQHRIHSSWGYLLVELKDRTRSPGDVYFEKKKVLQTQKVLSGRAEHTPDHASESAVLVVACPLNCFLGVSWRMVEKYQKDEDKYAFLGYVEAGAQAVVKGDNKHCFLLPHPQLQKPQSHISVGPNTNCSVLAWLQGATRAQVDNRQVPLGISAVDLLECAEFSKSFSQPAFALKASWKRDSFSEFGVDTQPEHLVGRQCLQLWTVILSDGPCTRF